MRNESATYAVLYDGDCRICTAFAHWVKAVDVRARMHIRPIQESRGLLRDIPGDEILDAMHAVTPDGRVLTGGDALLAILAALFSGPALETLLRKSTATTAVLHRVYLILVEFRGHLTCRFDAPSSSSAARSLR